MRETNFEPALSVANAVGLDLHTLRELGGGQIPTQPPPGGTTPFVGFASAPLLLSEFDLENATLALFRGPTM
ncbi:MAG: hypothetical protein U5K56_04510 [Halioglobus sp.]|nr:hypothetical protein [Halioglobus sp.]